VGQLRAVNGKSAIGMGGEAGRLVFLSEAVFGLGVKITLATLR